MFLSLRHVLNMGSGSDGGEEERYQKKAIGGWRSREIHELEEFSR